MMSKAREKKKALKVSAEEAEGSKRERGAATTEEEKELLLHHHPGAASSLARPFYRQSDHPGRKLRVSSILQE